MVMNGDDDKTWRKLLKNKKCFRQVKIKGSQGFGLDMVMNGGEKKPWGKAFENKNYFGYVKIKNHKALPWIWWWMVVKRKPKENHWKNLGSRLKESQSFVFGYGDELWWKRFAENHCKQSEGHPPSNNSTHNSSSNSNSKSNNLNEKSEPTSVRRPPPQQQQHPQQQQDQATP